MGVITLLSIAIALASFAFWIWTIIKVAQSKEDEFASGSMIVWIILIVVLGVIGSIIWYFVDWRARRHGPPNGDGFGSDFGGSASAGGVGGSF